MGKWLERFIEQRPRLALLAVIELFGLLTDIVVITPAVVSAAVAVVIAGAWCWWLENVAPITST